MFKIFFIFFIILAGFIFVQPVFAQNAILYFSPAIGTFSEGESFWINIMVDTQGQAVNAVAAYFSYPEDKLESLGVSVDNSVMTVFAEKGASAGKVKIASGLPTPGFSGIKKIVSVGFKVKVSLGSVNFKFSEDSAVITNAENKNILSLANSGVGNYSFKAKPASTLPSTLTPTLTPTTTTTTSIPIQTPVTPETEVSETAPPEGIVIDFTSILLVILTVLAIGFCIFLILKTFNLWIFRRKSDY